MKRLAGNAAARAGFRAAMDGKSIPHAWLFSGPEGVGKASFAHAAALRILAEGSGSGSLPGDFEVPPDHPSAHLFAAGSHPDYRLLTRLPKDPDKNPELLARGITIDQVRGIQPMLATTPSLGSRRVIVIDAIDDLEPPAANALLKNLEEPPEGTVFLLVSHAPGRLLPTIRSRCRALRFSALSAAEIREAIAAERPDASTDEIAALVRAGAGSPGRALRYAGLDLAGLEEALAGIARDGDPSNRIRARLAGALSAKAAQPRYEAFLDRAPSFISEASLLRQGGDLGRALDAYADARELAAAARRLSLDGQGTVFEMAGIVARLAQES